MRDSLLNLILMFLISSYAKRYEDINPNNDPDIFLSDTLY